LAFVSMLGIFACSAGSCTIAQRWLEKSCTKGATRSLEAELRAAGSHAERDLIAAYWHGSGTLGDEAAAEAGIQYDEVIAALNAGSTYGLSASEIAAFRADSKPVHIRQARDEYDSAYRRAALSGLGLLALPDGIAVLRSVARDPFSVDRDAAKQVLLRAGLHF
jgi:hypothetical protein